MLRLSKFGSNLKLPNVQVNTRPEKTSYSVPTQNLTLQLENSPNILKGRYGGFLKWWYPKSSHFNRVFRFSIIFTIHFGVPFFFWKHPYGRIMYIPRTQIVHCFIKLAIKCESVISSHWQYIQIFIQMLVFFFPRQSHNVSFQVG